MREHSNKTPQLMLGRRNSRWALSVVSDRHVAPSTGVGAASMLPGCASATAGGVLQ
jgi:hypothetical protein